jgi:hypothetical protein
VTADQRVQWIALPAGAGAAGTLRLSVVAAPRLRTDEGRKLAPFGDFLDWPARMRAATFTIEVGGVAVPAAVTGDPPDSELWTALFGPQTPLTPFIFDDYADRPFVTYGVGDVLEAIRILYARVAAEAPDDLPHIQGSRECRAAAARPDRSLRRGAECHSRTALPGRRRPKGACRPRGCPARTGSRRGCRSPGRCPARRPVA